MKGHIFYTGEKAKSEAMRFAIVHNMKTIDMTSMGKATVSWLNQIRKCKIEKEGWTDAEFWRRVERPVWENMSRSFAYSTPTSQKDIYVFIEREYYKNEKKFKNGSTAGILHSVEHPALKAMGKNIHVILV